MVTHGARGTGPADAKGVNVISNRDDHKYPRCRNNGGHRATCQAVSPPRYQRDRTSGSAANNWGQIHCMGPPAPAAWWAARAYRPMAMAQRGRESYSSNSACINAADRFGDAGLLWARGASSPCATLCARRCGARSLDPHQTGGQKRSGRKGDQGSGHHPHEKAAADHCESNHRHGQRNTPSPGHGQAVEGSKHREDPVVTIIAGADDDFQDDPFDDKDKQGARTCGRGLEHPSYPSVSHPSLVVTSSVRLEAHTRTDVTTA